MGGGSGLIKKILGEKIITSDIRKNPFIDYQIDLNSKEFPKRFNNYFDIIIFNHSLHHSHNPIKTLSNVKIMLKKNGLIIINEPETSIFFKLFLFFFDHETWNDNIKQSATKGFWYENNSTGKLLFARKKKGDYFLNDYKIIKNELSEFLIFLNSGGGGVNAPYIKLNNFFLKIIDNFDNFLINCFPNLFALTRTVVLAKIK